MSQLSSHDLPHWLPLDRLERGRCGVVVRVGGDAEDADRLKVMGLCVGRKVETIKPGDPLILRVLGSRLGLSARLAQRVMVDVCQENACAVRLARTPASPLPPAQQPGASAPDAPRPPHPHAPSPSPDTVGRQEAR